MQNNKIFIDFDGVIFDTEERVVKKKNELPELDWITFFNDLNWYELLEESQVINNSIDYILEGQDQNKQLYILTKIHTLLEMQAKTDKLRKLGLKIPLLFTPPHIKKSQIYLPQNKEVLIDDSLKNLKDWTLNGGTGIYFNEKTINDTGYETIKTLKKIL